MGIGRQVSIVVEEQMKFDRAFGASELCPREKGQAKRDRGAVQAQQLILEPEPVVPGSGSLAGLQGLVEQVSEHLPGAMGIRIGERGLVGGLLHAQMAHLSHAASQAATDLSQALRLGQLAEEHGYEMIPGIVSFCIPLGLMTHHQLMELPSMEKADQLTEQTCTTYHRFDPPFRGFFLLIAKSTHKEDFFN